LTARAELLLFGISVGDAGATIFAAALPFPTLLTKLNVSLFNLIGEAGLTVLQMRFLFVGARDSGSEPELHRRRGRDRSSSSVSLL